MTTTGRTHDQHEHGETATTSRTAGDRSPAVVARVLPGSTTTEVLDLNALCPNGCPHMECHGPGGTCAAGHCYACDACYCGEEW